MTKPGGAGRLPSPLKRRALRLCGRGQKKESPRVRPRAAHSLAIVLGCGSHTPYNGDPACYHTLAVAYDRDAFPNDEAVGGIAGP